MDEAEQSSSSPGDGVHSHEQRSSARQLCDKYHCPYYRHGIFPGLPKACHNGIKIDGIKRLIAHLKDHHCGNSNRSYAKLTESYVLSLKTLPNLKNMDAGEKWRAIYRDIFGLPVNHPTPPPFYPTFEQYSAATREGVAEGATEQTSFMLATAKEYVRNNNPGVNELDIDWIARDLLNGAQHLAKTFSETGGICPASVSVNGAPLEMNEFDPSHANYVSPDGNWP